MLIITPQIQQILNDYLDGVQVTILKGGARSGKTFSILEILILLALTDKKPALTSVVSMTHPHLRKGAINDFLEIMRREKLFSEQAWNTSISTFTFKNGSRIEFFPADSEKVHGPQRNRLFINEAQFIKWNAARHLLIRTSSTTYIDYNPIRPFWIDEEIMQNPEFDGAWKLYNSTYKDNPYLSDLQIRAIEANRKDAAWWQVYGEGKTGTMRTECVYSGWQTCSQQDFDAFDMPIIYALDFGVNDPTALVAVKVSDNLMYVKELIYESNLTPVQLAQRMYDLGITTNDIVIADSSGKPQIIQLNSGTPVSDGMAYFNIYSAWKPAGSIDSGISLVSGYDVYVCSGSDNVWQEYNEYKYRVNADNKISSTPIDAYNHALDAIRYVALAKSINMF